jgi:hypothetical protein
MYIRDVGMTRQHYTPGNINRIRMLVLHSTAGRFPGDYHWLRQGGSTRAPVSIHYYITKTGDIYRMVADDNIAWHAGRSTWVVDGEAIPYEAGCNSISLGIELENLNNGVDLYPTVQIEACVQLSRHLVQQYHIPRHLYVRHLDIAPGRKTDPAAFPWEAFLYEVYAADLPCAELPTPGTYVLRWPATVRTSAAVEMGNEHEGTPFAAGAWIDIAQWVYGEPVRGSNVWAGLASPDFEGCYIHISAFQSRDEGLTKVR